MHVQYVAICDQVILGNDGRPSLIGIFNDLQLPTLPVRIPRIAFAARLLFTGEECGKSHKVEVVLTDTAGAEIGRPGGDVSLPPLPPGIESLAVDVPMQFDFFEIAAFGRFTFLLHVDAAPVAAVQLSVRQGPAQP
ncbi:MAG: hypothetical protein M3081_10860 [Gemmatimonadota bacterium]|nr:hypothetical protein [Gemmatimonadota bacterium]